MVNTIALVLTLAFPFLVIHSSNAAIHVEKPKQFIRDTVPAVRFRLIVTPNDGTTDNMVLDITAGGSIGHFTDSAPGDYYINKARNLVAFNIDQLGDQQIFLVVQGSGGQLLVIRDFGNRVANLCQKAHHQFDGVEDEVDNVVGDEVSLSCISSDSKHDCFVKVRVSPDGQLSLVSYRLAKYRQ